jgi:hypothetical protein
MAHLLSFSRAQRSTSGALRPGSSQYRVYEGPETAARRHSTSKTRVNALLLHRIRETTPYVYAI